MKYFNLLFLGFAQVLSTLFGRFVEMMSKHDVPKSSHAQLKFSIHLMKTDLSNCEIMKLFDKFAESIDSKMK